MRIVATVSEWALAFALVKEATRYLAQCASILLTKIFLRRTDRMEIGWDNKVAGLPADRTSSEVVLGCAFVVGGTPGTNALEAEDVIAAVKHSELTARGEYFSQTDLTLGVIFLIECTCLCRIFLCELVCKLATIAISTAVRLEEHAYLLFGLSTESATLPLTR